MKSVNTNNQTVELATALNTTFDSGKIYTIQILNPCYLKLGNNDEFYYNSSELLNYDASKGEPLYIRTHVFSCQVAIVSSVNA